MEIRRELEWYWNKRVYVYPFKSITDTFNWLDWRNIKDSDYKNMLQDYCNVDAVGLNLVCGKKGVCGIGIRRDDDNRHSLEILFVALQYLNLPQEYPWVISTPHEYIIIVDVQNSFSNKDIKQFEYIRIIWETFIQLPIRGRATILPSRISKVLSSRSPYTNIKGNHL